MARTMKDSGVEWIGEIPEEWEVTKLKNIIQFINGYAFNSNDLSTKNEGFPVIRIGDFTNFGIDFNSANRSTKDVPSISKYLIDIDDILIAMSGGTVGKLSYVNEISEKAYINQRVGIIRAKNSKFVYYYLNSGEFLKYIFLLASGTAQPNISTGNINNYPIVCPLEVEQQKIAAFLDDKTSQIDFIIAKTKQSIEAFKAYKQALITQTVTNGLNPDAKMKDSGIEWLGEIPEHWEVTKIKNIVKIVNGKDNVVKDGDIPVYGSSATPFGFTDKIMHDKETVLLGRKGTIDKPQFVTEPFWAVDTVFYTIPKRNTALKFFFYCMSVFDYKKYTYGSAIPSMSQGILNEIKLPYPILKEQQQIADFLDEKTAHIHSLIANKEKMVQELETYKKSMIYEYVTGKKEVE